jgi:hypothetical protein
MKAYSASSCWAGMLRQRVLLSDAGMHHELFQNFMVQIFCLSTNGFE